MFKRDIYEDLLQWKQSRRRKPLVLRGARQVQEEIIETYLLDFSKHAEKNEVLKISLTWKSIPAQSGRENKKFIFSAIQKGARAREYENALQWLTDAGLIYKSYNISTPRFPLISYAYTNIFKVYLLDVGLLGAMSNLSPGLLIRGNEIFTGFYGSLVENYAVQQLVGKYRKELFYWTSPGKAEVDFVFPAKESIYPLYALSLFPL